MYIYRIERRARRKHRVHSWKYFLLFFPAEDAFSWQLRKTSFVLAFPSQEFTRLLMRLMVVCV